MDSSESLLYLACMALCGLPPCFIHYFLHIPGFSLMVLFCYYPLLPCLSSYTVGCWYLLLFCLFLLICLFIFVLSFLSYVSSQITGIPCSISIAPSAAISCTFLGIFLAVLILSSMLSPVFLLTHIASPKS